MEKLQTKTDQLDARTRKNKKKLANYGVTSGIRTHDPQNHNLML